jgi:hypothetical protein
MATSKAFKSLKKALQFIKWEPIIQLLIINFVTVLFLIQKPLYILLIIKLNLLAILSLPQTAFIWAYI